MRSGLSQAQEQALMRPAPDIMPPPAAAPATKEIPYDYVAKFKLQGKPGNRVQDVINVSVEGGFVAVAIGYSVIPANLSAVPLSSIPVTLISAGQTLTAASPQDTSLIEIIAETVAAHLTPNIRFEKLAEAQPPQATVAMDRKAAVKQLMSVIQPVFGDPRILLQCLLIRFCGIDFKYSIVDSGTGRELQNQPIHNIAGLGEATGDTALPPLG